MQWGQYIVSAQQLLFISVPVCVHMSVCLGSECGNVSSFAMKEHEHSGELGCRHSGKSSGNQTGARPHGAFRGIQPLRAQALPPCDLWAASFPTALGPGEQALHKALFFLPWAIQAPCCLSISSGWRILGIFFLLKATDPKKKPSKGHVQKST